MLQGRDHFTSPEVATIRELLMQLARADSSNKKSLRSKLRRIGFYIRDFDQSGSGFKSEDFDRLVECGTIKINSSVNQNSAIKMKSSSSCENTQSRDSDECYVINLCDEVLGVQGVRQKRFPFLTGDSGSTLPVDCYYQAIELVVEYRERQHTEPVKHFDKRMTVSGVDRGTQRKIYDQRRREVLPKHGIMLIELSYDMFDHNSNKRLLRNRNNDIEVVKKKLRKWKN